MRELQLHSRPLLYDDEHKAPEDVREGPGKVEAGEGGGGLREGLRPALAHVQRLPGEGEGSARHGIVGVEGHLSVTDT